MKYFIIYLTLVLSPLTFSDAKVYFINIKDGDQVKSPFLLQFGLSGKGVAPAGTNRENTGHHHLLIDVDKIDFKTPIPSSENHIHFGVGQTESIIELTPGTYSLQLVLGDMSHIPHNPAVISSKISVTVIQ